MIALILTIATSKLLPRTVLNSSLNKTSPFFKLKLIHDPTMQLVAFLRPAFNSDLKKGISVKFDKENCSFEFPNKLCLFDNGTVQEHFEVQVRCKEYPCSFNVTAYNRIEKQLSENVSFYPLVSLGKVSEGQFVSVEQNKPQLIQEFFRDFQFYSSEPLAQTVLNNNYLILFFKNTPEMHLLFFNFKKIESDSLNLTRGDAHKSLALSDNSAAEFLLSSKHSFQLASKSNNSFTFIGINVSPLKRVQSQFVVKVFFPQTQEQYSFEVDPDDLLEYYTVLLETSDKWSSFDIKSKEKFYGEVLVERTDNLSLDPEEMLITKLQGKFSVKWRQQSGNKTDSKLKIYNYVTQKEIKTTPETCFFNKPCEFALTTSGKSVTIVAEEEKVVAGKVRMIAAQNSETLKINAHESIYRVIQRQDKKQKLISVNSDDVIVYVSFKQSCPNPSPKCFSLIGSKSRPVQLVNKLSKQALVYLGFYSSSTRYFTYEYSDFKHNDTQLTLDKQVYGEIDDLQPSLYTFTAPAGIDQLQFRLNCPPNRLGMYINRGTSEPDSQNYDYVDNKGLITVKLKAKEANFSILINKLDDNDKLELKFSLIVTADNSSSFMAVGEAQMVNLQSSKTEQLILIVDPSHEVFVNLQIKSDYSKLKFTLKKGNQEKTLKISRNLNSIDITPFIKKNCPSAEADLEENQEFSDEVGICHINFVIHNQNNSTAQFFVTLFEQTSVIELRQGLWNSFDSNTIDKMIKFYYQISSPCDLTVYSYSSSGTFAFSVSLFSPKTITPKNHWPFPASPKLPDNLRFTQFAKVSASKIEEECQEECYLLISIGSNQSDDQDEAIERQQSYGVFSLIVSGNSLQLKESQRMTVEVSKEQPKLLSFDLAQILAKSQDVVFNMQMILGNAVAYITVSSNQNVNIPSAESSSSILYETTYLEFKQIQELITQSGVGLADSGIKLMILLNSDSFSQVNIGVNPSFSTLTMLNEFQPSTVQVETNKTVIMGISNIFFTEFKVKLQRLQGFPVAQLLPCKDQLKLAKCIEQANKKKDDQHQVLRKNHQINVKLDSFQEIPNLYLLVIYAPEQAARLTVYFLPKDSPINIPEASAYSDFLDGNEQQIYTLTMRQQHKLKLVININQGSVVLKAPNKFSNLFEAKTFKQQNGVIHYQLSIPSLKDIFYPQLPVTISCSQDCTFSFFYTVSDVSVTLVEGLFVTAVLDSASPAAVFSYEETKNEIAHLKMFFQDTVQMGNTQITLSTFKVGSDNVLSKVNQTKVEAKLFKYKDMPDSPVIAVDLTPNLVNQIKLQVRNFSKTAVKLIVTGLDIVQLPLDIEFPAIIAQKYSHFYQVDILQEMTLRFVINLCSQADLSIGIVQDYDDFLNNRFTYEAQVSKVFRFQKIAKFKEGSIFIKISTSSKQEAFYKVSVQLPSNGKCMVNAGNKGELEYDVIDQHRIKLKFYPPLLQNCPKDMQFKYQVVSGNDRLLVLSQTHCPSMFFGSQDDGIMTNLKPRPIAVTGSAPLEGVVKLKGEQSVLSVRALSESGVQVGYGVVQLNSGWKALHNNLMAIKVLLGVIACLTCYFVFCRKKEYIQITDQQ